MSSARPRTRDLGLRIGRQPTGTLNAITDVPGVRVGHVTLIRGEGPLRIGEGPVRTGVTALLPPGDDWRRSPVEAGCFVFNGAGTTAGLSLIDEFGKIETPLCLTNTLSVGAVYEGIVRYMVENIFRERGAVPWFNPVVGETSDAYLNDIGGLHVRPEHTVEAIANAVSAPTDQLFDEGSIGAGTGTTCLGFKGGIGTSSRQIEIEGETSTVGVLVQSNFGGRLTICGVPMDDIETSRDVSGGASIMILVATDLPLDNRLLNRISKRATFGMARTGSRAGHASGDYVIAFSTTYRDPDKKPATRHALSRDESLINSAFAATADATEEAILNSMFRAETMTGRDGNVLEAIDIDRVLAILDARGVVRSGAA